MEFKSIQDYSGFTFNEKKAFKERESTQWWTAQKHINEKLGADWKLIIDWPEFAKAIPGGEGNYEARDNFQLTRGRTDLAFCIYETFVETLGKDVTGWEPDFCEAVNEKVTKKIIRITTWNGVDHLDSYISANKTDIINGEIVVLVQPRRVTERFCDSWNTPTDKTFKYFVDLGMMKPTTQEGEVKSAPEEPFVSIQDYSGFSFHHKKIFKEREERLWFPSAVNDKVTKKIIRVTVWPIDNDNLDSYKIEIVDGVILISVQPTRLTHSFSPFAKVIGNLV